jgi:hypothetical protein
MSTHSIRRRVKAIERVISPIRDDGTVTVEQLLRSIWKSDRNGYMQLVDEHAFGAGLLLPTFQREDELAKANARGSSSRPMRNKVP